MNVESSNIKEAIEAQCIALKTQFEKAQVFNVEFEGSEYQADSKSYNEMLAVINQNEFPADFFWLDANNNRKVMDKTKMLALVNAVFVARFQIFKNYQDKKEKVRQAVTIDEIFSN